MRPKSFMVDVDGKSWSLLKWDQSSRTHLKIASFLDGGDAISVRSLLCKNFLVCRVCEKLYARKDFDKHDNTCSNSCEKLLRSNNKR